MEKVNNIKNLDKLDKPVTLGLFLEFLDDVFIPKVAELINEAKRDIKLDVKQAISSYEYNIKSK